MASESAPLLPSTSAPPSSTLSSSPSAVPRSFRRTRTSHQNIFTRPLPNAVTYDLSTPDQATIRLPPGSAWTSGPHWHDTHTEFLQVIKGRAEVTLGYGRPPKRRRRRQSGSGARGASEGYADDDDDEGEEEEEGKGVTTMPCVTPLDGVVIVPRRTVHEWRRSRAALATGETDEELVVREWTDPKDGQKESFFRNLNGLILDALAAEAAVVSSGPGDDGTAKARGGGGNGGGNSAPPKSRQLRALDLELNNLFWRRDNWPLVLERESRWPGWAHRVATRSVLLWSVMLGRVLGCKGVYEEYEVRT